MDGYNKNIPPGNPGKLCLLCFFCEFVVEYRKIYVWNLHDSLGNFGWIYQVMHILSSRKCRSHTGFRIDIDQARSDFDCKLAEKSK